MGLLVTAAWLWRLEPGDGHPAGLPDPVLPTGASVGLSFMPLDAKILARVEPREAGAASALLQTLQWLGGTLGLSVLFTVFVQRPGTRPAPRPRCSPRSRRAPSVRAP